MESLVVATVSCGQLPGTCMVSFDFTSVPKIFLAEAWATLLEFVDAGKSRLCSGRSATLCFRYNVTTSKHTANCFLCKSTLVSSKQSGNAPVPQAMAVAAPCASKRKHPFG